MTDQEPLEARVRIALRWRDMDMLGHLNQAVYHELLEEGRGALIGALGRDHGFPFVLARVELDYRHEVRHRDGHVDIVTRVERVGAKSITITHELTLPDGTPAAVGRSVLVAWDPEARAARTLTGAERAALGARAAEGVG
jgi:acyl-CoA thioester hydrolase